jgi:hypothetical protein
MVLKMSGIAIVGSRDYPDLEAVRTFVRALPKYATVISGGARGVDSVAEDEAKKCGLSLIIHRADWDKHGKAAGVIRNKLIVEDCDELMAFWDGTSRGTKNSVDLAKKLGKKITVNLKRKDTNG